MKYKVISVSSLWVKSEASPKSKDIGILSPGSIVEIEQVSNGWYKIENGGWVYAFGLNGSMFLEKIQIISPSTSNNIVVGSSVKITGDNAYFTPDSSGVKIPDNLKEDTFVVNQISGDNERIRINNGTLNYWVYTSDLSVINVAPVENVPGDVGIYQNKTNTNSLSDELYIPTIDSSVDSRYGELLNGLRVKTLRGVHGMPYQYMEIADTRIDNASGSFGRKYADKIVARMPLLLLTPGTPEFLSGYSEQEKTGLVQTAISMFGDNDRGSQLDNILKQEGRYYSLKTDWVGYFNHVNPLCRAAARFLQIHDREIDGVKLDNYDWSNNYNEEIHKYLAYRGSVAFYINSDTQISDSFSTNTTESMLANKVNSISEMGRELNFLLGGASNMTGQTLDALNQENLLKGLNNSQDFASKILSGNNLFSGIASGLQTVVAGGKLIFPEIWSDSSFSRSYDVNFKLTTPDNDDFSWFINIAVPIFLMVCFSAPRQAGVNGYVSPYLLRGYYKGLFNCNMGIVTGISINKGQEGSWTKSGLPTVVDVSMSIKDLYNIMAITSNANIKYGLMNNIALMDYVANMCGVNINEPDVKRTIDMYYTQNIRNKVVDSILLNVAGGLDQWATSKVLKIFTSNR